MAKAAKPPQVDDLAVLFPEEQVGPYTIRPWTLRQFGLVFKILAELLQNLGKLGLTFDNAETFLVERWTDILPEVLPYLPDIVEVSLHLTPAEIDRLDAGTQAALGLRILLANQDSLKNFLTLALGSGKPGGMATA